MLIEYGTGAILVQCPWHTFRERQLTMDCEKCIKEQGICKYHRVNRAAKLIQDLYFVLRDHTYRYHQILERVDVRPDKVFVYIGAKDQSKWTIGKFPDDRNTSGNEEAKYEALAHQMCTRVLVDMYSFLDSVLQSKLLMILFPLVRHDC